MRLHRLDLRCWMGLPMQPDCRMLRWRHGATLVSLNVAWYLLAKSQLGQGDPCIYAEDLASLLSLPPAAQSSHKNGDTV